MPTTRSGKPRSFPPALSRAELCARYERCPNEPNYEHGPKSVRYKIWLKPGTFPLVDGAPARVGRLRAYGNAGGAA